MDTITAPELQSNVEAISGTLQLGKGAQLWVYVSPQNNTEQNLTSWDVTFQHVGSNWSGTITSRDPQQILQTPNLSGMFTILARGSNRNSEAVFPIPPKPPSTDQIGCNSNCGSFVGLVSNPGGKGATYWTTWDAICSRN